MDVDCVNKKRYMTLACHVLLYFPVKTHHLSVHKDKIGFLLNSFDHWSFLLCLQSVSTTKTHIVLIDVAGELRTN